VTAWAQWTPFDVTQIETPVVICDRGRLRANLAVLDDVQRRAGCTILLALKGFANWRMFDLIRDVLGGVAASSVFEARLGREELGQAVHSYAPAFSDADFDVLLGLSDHIVFNSLQQWRRLRERAMRGQRAVKFGLRVNPGESVGETPMYDPCGEGSRLGITRSEFSPDELEGISGLHFHARCEQNADALERVLAAFEQRFGEFLPGMSWVNFGGGHHITRPGYDIERLIALVRGFRERHPITVFLEPGEAVGLNVGVLVASVLDIVHNGQDIAILDTSASAHMPDVLEMPYRPAIVGGHSPGKARHTYRLGGVTCLAGDVIGDYSFEQPLAVGDRLVFLDMAHYTTVKTTTFNGVRPPSLAVYEPSTRSLEIVRRFGYEDFRDRLG
jgi:carboxynorspermidine decarboxylase